MNRFKLDENVIISFSGGRTSGLMLHKTLEVFGGKLPDNYKVLFQNTGKERLETLDFVHEVEKQWDVPIVWLEFVYDEDSKKRFKIVDYETASRGGDPFSAMIEWKGILPNPVMRTCTQHLKVGVMRSFVRNSLLWDGWSNFIGIRYDEPRRWRIEGIDPQYKREERMLPLRHAGITEKDVMKFWSAQPFDLMLKQHEGNCDLCFLKGRSKKLRIIRDNPSLAQWWIDEENKPRKFKTGVKKARFRNDQTYKDLLRIVKDQPMLPGLDNNIDDLGDCLCHD